MKIYIIKVNKKFQPKKQIFKYPKHNNDYGVEQDFLNYLIKNPDIITDNPEEADWHYLPIFWTRFHLNNNYGKNNLDELQKECNEKIINSKKTFCVCQYDDGPLVNLGDTVQFLSSRKSEQGIDIPLLCKQHKTIFLSRRKKYKASFIGRLNTHPIRKKMFELLKNKKDIYIVDGNFGSRFFVGKTLKSFLSLAPRGYGGSSFRLFESMQLGVVPMLISDIDTRPFRKFINWDEFSFYVNDASLLLKTVESLDKEKLVLMGRIAQQKYYNELCYYNWCKYVLKELKNII